MNLMQRAVARRYSREEGLTLIELLIVVLILGILSTIVVLGIGAFTGTGEEEACKATVGNVEAAAAAFYAKNDQTWPADVGALVGAGNYLKSAPDPDYNITIDPATGEVSDDCDSL